MTLLVEDADCGDRDLLVQRALGLLSEALGIIDELATAPEIGARLDGLIESVRAMQPSHCFAE